MSSRTRLLNSIATTIQDYRQGEIPVPTADHVDTWVKQFDLASQNSILQELDHVLDKTYIDRANVMGFLAAVLTNAKIAGSDPAEFWQGVNFLNIQGGGNSQREMLSIFESLLLENWGFGIDDCGQNGTTFVYLDDVIFTGNRVLNDLRSWILKSAPKKSTVHVITIGFHRGGRHYADNKIADVASENGKMVELSWWRCIEIEDTKAHINTSDVLRPTHLPDDELVTAYAAELKYPVTFRRPGSMGENKFFSSEEGRDALEQEFLKAGARIRAICPYLNKYQRPLGNMVLETLGRFYTRDVQKLPKQRAACLLGWQSLVSVVPTENELMSQPLEPRTYRRDECAVFRKTNEVFGGLSNMAPGFPVRVNGVFILTVEALYQACRFPHMSEIQRLILEQRSPMTAKMVGKPYRQNSRPDWDLVRVKIMRWCLRLKLLMNRAQFSELLLETGDRPIVEDSRKDNFWGALRADSKTLVGMNVLGRLLMELREEIKQSAELLRLEPPAIPDFLLYGKPMGVVDFRIDKSVPSHTVPEISEAPILETFGSLFSGTLAKSPITNASESSLSLNGQGNHGMIKALKPYSEYKDSGSKWLGAVPVKWEVRNLRTLIAKRNERNRADLPLLSVAREKGVFVRSLTDADENHNVIPEDLSNYKVARAGNLVINKMKAWQGSMGIAPCDGIVSPAYFVFDFHVTNRAFGQRLLRSKPYVAHFAQASDGVRVGQWDLSISGMRQIPLLLPNDEEQAAIVRFLDYANWKIDRFIRTKRNLIALLNEQKQVIIHRAVTRGLDANVRLKPSGIPWLGDIPAHWQLKRIKYILREVDRRSKDASETLLSMRMHHGLVVFAEHFSRPPQAASLIGFKIVEPGQFVVNRMQAGNGVIYPSHLTGLVSPDYAVFEPISDVNVDYLGELFRSRAVRAKFRSESKGLGNGTSGFLRLYNDRFGAIHIPLPARTEQDSILDGLGKELAGINAPIDRTEREIALLQEYRARLTADIVTGKLDVREAAAKVPDVETDIEVSPDPAKLDEGLLDESGMEESDE
jgi:type I restriction enzyme, S subunit